MTDPARTAGSTKRRQYLLLGGLIALLLGAALLAAFLTGSRDVGERPVKPKTSSILAPGAQVDPRDAWRGQADAQLKSMEQQSRELTQRGSELDTQSKQMLERLQKLEQTRLTPLPPPPLPMPAARPEFGPDRAIGELAGGASAQFLPPPPSATPAAQNPQARSGAAISDGTLQRSTIVSITLADPVSAPKGKAESSSTKSTTAPRDTRRYLPSGAFARAVLLGGLDAPTGGQAQRNPQPVLLRLADHAVLPNQFRGRVKECFVVGAGYGDISSERAYVRTESLSCVTRDGTAIDVPIKGYITGEDGKAGLRGRLVSKQGQLLANALIAGIASGIGQAFQQSGQTVSVSPLGTTSTVNPGQQFEAGMGAGVGKALDRLAQYYISLAEKVFPVIEVDAGRAVDVVLTQGIALQGTLDADARDRDEFPQLATRNQQTRRNDDDEDD